MIHLAMWIVSLVIVTATALFLIGVITLCICNALDSKERRLRGG